MQPAAVRSLVRRKSWLPSPLVHPWRALAPSFRLPTLSTAPRRSPAAVLVVPPRLLSFVSSTSSFCPASGLTIDAADGGSFVRESGAQLTALSQFWLEHGRPFRTTPKPFLSPDAPLASFPPSIPRFDRGSRGRQAPMIRSIGLLRPKPPWHSPYVECLRSISLG